MDKWYAAGLVASVVMTGSSGAVARECLPLAADRDQPFLGKEIGSCMVAGLHSFGLKNRATIEIIFKVKTNSGDWRDLQIGPKGSDAVFCTSCSQFEILIPSETQDKNYIVYPEKRYAIFWNDAIRAWDVVEEVD